MQKSFRRTRGRCSGRYSSATLIGRSLAPLAGGAIISFFVFYPGLIPYRIVYLAAAVIAVPVLLLILLYRKESGGPLKVLPFSMFRTSFLAFFANRKLRATASVDMATYFAFGAFETFLPLVLLSRGMGAYQAGILFAVQTLIIALTKPFFGRMADRVDKKIQIISGLLVLGCSVAAIPFASSFAVFLLVSALLAARHVALYGCDQRLYRGYCKKRTDGSIDGGPLIGHGYRAFRRPPPYRDYYCRQRLRCRVPGKLLVALVVCGFFAVSVWDPEPLRV